MKWLLGLCLFFLMCQSAWSQLQNDRIEELEWKLGSSVHDTAYVNLLNELAILCYTSHPDKTKTYSSIASRQADSLKYPRGIADACYTKSLISKLKGDYTEELDLHIKSLKIYESLYDTLRIARAHDAMGAVYTQKKDFISAREAHLKAMDLFKIMNDQNGLAMNLRRIGNIELDTKNYEQALYWYRLALKNEEVTGNEQGIANCLNNIGVAYYEKKNYDSALFCYKKTLIIMERINYLNRMPAIYYNIARVYLDQGKVDDALMLAKKGFPVAMKIGSRPAQRESNKLLSDIYEKKGDHAQAFKHLVRYNELRDSIINHENNLQFTRLQSVHKIEEKEKEIELLKKDNQLTTLRQRATIAGLVLFLVAGGFVIYIQRGHIKQKKKSYELVKQHNEFVQQVNEELKTNLEEIEAKNKEIQEIAGHLQQLNATKDKLFSIIGHDLRSPINSLQSLLSLVASDTISKEEFQQFSTKLKEDVDHFGFTLVNLLQWAKSQMEGLRTFRQETDLHELVNSNINFLKKSASAKAIDLINQVSGSIILQVDQDQLNVVLRNLISNAIKFTPAKGTITIGCSTNTPNKLRISVTDTGVGMHQEALDKLFNKNINFTTAGTNGEHGSGLGLLLCREMIEKNEGKLWAESKPGIGTTFHIELPS